MALDITRFIHRFIDESRDMLRLLYEGIRQLEQGQHDSERVNSLFRSAHTMKGSARMLNLVPIAEVAHSLEELLSALREEKATISPAIIDGFYQAVDCLTNMVEKLAESGQATSIPSAPQSLCEQLLQLANSTPVSTPDSQPDNLAATGSAAPTPTIQPPVTAPVPKQAPTLTRADSVRLRLENLEQLGNLIAEVTASHAGLREIVRDAQALQADWYMNPHRAHDPQSFAVLLSNLKDIVGSQENLIHSLHDQALDLRMLPLSQVFEPAAKHIRETGRMLGKFISSQISGTEIELDRSIIEQLSEPLIHLLRNAIDHGIEEPAIRLAAGKSETGLIRLTARQESGWVIIELADDGAGICPEKVRHKLSQQQTFSEAELASLSDAELLAQVFLPGFSTSNIITEISGRGVGLDVVKRKVENDLHGMLEIQSHPGQGSCFTLRLPLSLAMLHVLLVSSGDHIFGFTSQYVVELTYLPTNKILEIADRNVFVLRNEFIPIFKLSELLELPAADEPQNRNELLLLVVRVQHEKVALVIDSLVDEHDFIIKPLPSHLTYNPLVSGLINHGYQKLVSLMHVPGILDVARRNNQKSRTAPIKTTKRQHLLVVDDSLNTREIEKDVLEAWGYQVTLAEDGLDGLNKARNGDFDAIITDVEMPFMDGFTLTSHLREHERYKNRPIIIITSREKDSDRRRGIEVGADAYIVKGSFDQNNLVDTLRALLG